MSWFGNVPPSTVRAVTAGSLALVLGGAFALLTPGEKAATFGLTRHGQTLTAQDAGAPDAVAVVAVAPGTAGQVYTISDAGLPHWAAATGGSAPREGALADRGAASSYPGGYYLVTSGTDSLWTLWQSLPVSGTATWVRRPYRVPTDTITPTGMLARWDFSGLTRSSATVENSINPGTGDLSIGTTLRDRLLSSTADPTTWWGLQSLPVTATADEPTNANLDLSAPGGVFEPAGDWTVAAWVARNTAFTPSYGLYVLDKRISASVWGSGNFAAVELGIDTAFRAFGSVHHGGGPSYAIVTATTALSPARLTLLTLTYVASTGTLTLYVDGVAEATTAGLGAIYWGATPGPWCVGGNSLSTGATVRQAWPGWVGEVQVSGVAASAAEVARHYGLLAGGLR